MTLQEYDKKMADVAKMHKEARAIDMLALWTEEKIYKDACLECHSREPGFPDWTSSEIHGYFNTPRQVLEAIQAQAEEAEKNKTVMED